MICTCMCLLQICTTLIQVTNNKFTELLECMLIAKSTVSYFIYTNKLMSIHLLKNEYNIEYPFSIAMTE